MLQVSRATTPERNLIAATEKSGVITSRGGSVSLSGIRQEENAVTVSAGPKKPLSQVTAYPACSMVHPTSNSSL
jgi:hypothetical protein